MDNIADINAAIKEAVPEQIEAPRPLMRELPKASAYPIEALGELLGPTAKAIHEKTQAPLAMCAQGVLAAATLAVQGHTNVTLPMGQSKPISEFFLSLGGTGERKSAVDAEAGWPIRKHESNLREDYANELPSFLNSKEVWDKERQTIIGDRKLKGMEAKKEALEMLGPEPVAPLTPMLTSPDPTFEGMAKLYAIGHPSMGLFTAEGGMFIGGHGMTQENKLKTATGLSCLWDGDPIRRVRAGDGATILPGRRLALHLMVQPDVASVMLSDRVLADQGLLSRLLVVAPESSVGIRMWKETSPESEATIRKYGAALLRILETQPNMAEGKQNELEPRSLSMSPNARTIWIRFADHTEHQMAPGGGFESIRGLANKLPEHAARLAGVLALVDDLNATTLEAKYLAAGILLAQHYAAEANRLFMGGVIDPDILLAQKTLDWLNTTWTEPYISTRVLYRLGPNPVRTVNAARKVANTLETHGWLIPVEQHVEVDGHKTLDAWRVVKRENSQC